MQVCPKCGYERQASDDAFISSRECPKCGVVYEKVIASDDSGLAYKPIEKNIRQEAVNLRYAGFWIRTVATLIDTILMTIITMPIMVRHYGWSYLDSNLTFYGSADFLVTWVLPAIATIAFWVFKSATPGKMAIGARIVDATTGGEPSLGQYVGRYFSYILSTLFFFLGFIWVAFDGRKQGWHDKLAGTVVVRRKHPDTVTFG